MKKIKEVTLADFSEKEISQGLERLEGWLSRKKALSTADDPLILPNGITAEKIVNTLKARETEKSFGQNDIFENIFISYLQGQKKRIER